MSFLVDEKTRVLIQGITGQLGRTVVDFMARGGFAPVAGVTPGRGGASVQDIPVFDTVAEAVADTGATASLILVPAQMLRDAAMEAIAGGLSPIVLMVDGVPLEVSLDIITAARKAGVTLIGPNSPGILSPGKGMLGALDPSRFRPGDIAVVSRSGGMMSTLAYTLASQGLGTSTCIGIGGDSVIGLDMPSAVLLAEQDPETRAILIYGEIGTTQEERVAELVQAGAVTKPVLAYVAGVAAPSGIRYSHAGAQSDGEVGSAAVKKRVLADAGVRVLDRYVDIGSALAATGS